MKRKPIALIIFVLIFSLLSSVVPAHGEEIALSAPAAVLMDSATGEVLYEKNSHEQRPCASITKIMTLSLVFEAIDEGKLTVTDTLMTSAHASSMGGSDIWLEPGESMTVDELLKATVIVSANDAAVVLAEAVAGSEDAFVKRMNEKANELGMKDTVFRNCNGLDEDGHVTSAHDVALMSRELIRHSAIFNYTNIWIENLRNGETQLVNTNKLLRSYNGITGLKTGTTSKAGSCISATAERDSLSLVSVILGAPNSESRFKDAAVLLDYGFANWSTVIPEKPSIGEIDVKNGMQKTVIAESDPPPKVLLHISDEKEITNKIIFKENLTAPVKTGDIVGKIVYSSGGKTLAETEIRAASNSDAITFLSSFVYLLQSLIRL